MDMQTLICLLMLCQSSTIFLCHCREDPTGVCACVKDKCEILLPPGGSYQSSLLTECLCSLSPVYSLKWRCRSHLLYGAIVCIATKGNSHWCFHLWYDVFFFVITNETFTNNRSQPQFRLVSGGGKCIQTQYSIKSANTCLKITPLHVPLQILYSDWSTMVL